MTRKINAQLFILAGFIGIYVLGITGCTKRDSVGKYPIEPVPFTAVKVTDHFWLPRMKTNQEVTIPIAMHQNEITGRVDNFRVAAGLKEGGFQSQMVFDDTDVYKMIEAASYSLQTSPNPELESRLDSLIKLIGKAQESDGYVYTNLTIAKRNGTKPHEWVGSDRWEKVHDLSHELYNHGHMFEAAVAHFQATGKRNFLDIAIKAADMLDRTFGWGKLEDYPGHQVVELGLIKLYHVTREKRYLDLAKFFLDVRGPNGPDYCQAHAKVIDQREAAGHAVRATYMYAAMADIATLYQDTSYLHAIRFIWEDMVYKKTYLTGGIGASGGNEGFGNPYDLPNMSAYCETCASIGNVMWNYRMFLIDGESKYYDMLERTLYNALLSGVSLSGDRFFYPNVLESIGQHERSKWFGTACCPPNISRTLSSLPGYIYSRTHTDLFVNLFMSSTANLQIRGKNLEIVQETEYPYNGTVQFTINPTQKTRFALKIRIPGWAKNEAIPGNLYRFANESSEKIGVKINNSAVEPLFEKGYAVLDRKWTNGDKVTLELQMNPRIVLASDSVKSNRNKMAIQRGPIVYAAEWPDATDGRVLNLMFDRNQTLTTEFKPDLLKGIAVVHAKAKLVQAKPGGGVEYGEDMDIQLIPYATWNNRGAGEMMVWLPYNEKSVRPLPSPTIASKSKISGSKPTKSLIALNDQLLPESSNDHTWPFYHWWPVNNSWQWLQYNFEKPAKVTLCRVYWFDDGPWGGCRIPDEWRIEYQSGNNWLPVKAINSYKITKDGWDELKFNPVTTSALRLNVKLSKEFSSGVHEWVVE